MELLELYLSPLDAQRFQAIATRSPEGVGDASTESVLPFWLDGQDWRLTIIKTLESSRFRPENFSEADEQEWLVHEGLLLPDRQSFHTAYLQKVGQSLYCSLFPPDGALKQAFLHSLRLAEQRHTDLHLRLKFAAASVERSRLADYPWELLHDGQRFLLHQKVRLSRYIAHDASPPSFPAQESLRVLLVSARPQGLPQLSLKEQQAIQLGLQRAQDAGSVQLHILPSPTRKALSRYLTECLPEQLPQVLHFDGHGVFGKRCSNSDCLSLHAGIKLESCRTCGRRLPDEPQGYLVFETEQGQPDYQSATQVTALLQPYSIALAVLSACQSGMSVAGDSVFNGVAQKLIDQRLPAVVAMQYSVQADAACEFAEQFYRLLGNKKSLLMALNQGSRAMDVEGNQWYRPVLYLRWHDNEGGQLFTAASSNEDTSINEYRQRAAQLIANSYARSRSLDRDCKKRLETLQDKCKLLNRQAKQINQELLKLCQDEEQRIQCQIEQYKYEIQSLIEESPSLNNEVRKKLKDLEIVYEEIEQETVGLLFVQLGHRLWKEHKSEWTIECFEKAITFDPKNTEAYVSLATFLWERNRLEEAIRLLEIARELCETQLAPELQTDKIDRSIQQLMKSLKRKQSRFFGLSQMFFLKGTHN